MAWGGHRDGSCEQCGGLGVRAGSRTLVRQAVDQIDRLLLAGKVRAAVGTLSPRHREVLREVYFEGRPAAEVAVRLGVPVEIVQSRTYNAVRALKDALAERTGCG